MYSVRLKTTNSDVEFGVSISSTPKLHEFLTAMDFQLVTSLEIHYYRELKTPHDFQDVTTQPNPVVGRHVTADAHISHGPDSWTIETPNPETSVIPGTHTRANLYPVKD